MTTSRLAPDGRSIGTSAMGSKAATLWQEVSGRSVDPTGVVVLKEKKSGVYLLPGASPDCRAIVAKRGSESALSSELAYYRDVAPRLPLRTLTLLGTTVDPPDVWLFLEDAGNDHFDGSAEQRDALTDWLAKLHLSTVDRAVDGVPRVGPERYLAHLQSTRRSIARGSGNSSLSAADRVVLGGVDALLERTAGVWGAVHERCHGAPCVLVHGDLVAKNIHIQTHGTSSVPFPVDWETAGWGVPATDLSTSANAKLSSNPDLESYISAAGGLYPGWDLERFERLAAIGALFRALAAMDWVARRLAYEWTARPMRDLPAFAGVVEDSLDRAGIAAHRRGRDG